MCTSIARLILLFLRQVNGNKISHSLPYSSHCELKILLNLQSCKRVCLRTAIYFKKFLKLTHKDHF